METYHSLSQTTVSRETFDVMFRFACRVSIFAAAGFALSMLPTAAPAQSLFSSRGGSGQNQSSGSTSTGSLFSRNTGFPSGANANQTQSAGNAFVGRSNRGFVGGGGTGQSSSSNAEFGGASRSPATRRAAAGAAEGNGSTPLTGREGNVAPGLGQRKPIVPRHRIAFAYPAREKSAIGEHLRTQLAKLAVRNPAFATIEVQVEADGQVRLQGRVPADDTRKLAALLVGFEPGVRGVRNELVVEADRD
jgi:hypothetical protein